MNVLKIVKKKTNEYYCVPHNISYSFNLNTKSRII